MGGKEDGRAVLAHLFDLAADHLGIDGVKTAERLVEDHDLRLVEDVDDKLNLLRHPLGEFLDFLSAQFSMPNLASHLRMRNLA